MAIQKRSKKEELVQQLDERLLELSSLFEISHALTSSLSIRAILENILRIPMGHMLISRGVVFLKMEEGDEFTIEEVRGLSRDLLGKSLRFDPPPSRFVLIEEVEEENDWIEFFKEFQIELLLPLNTTQGAIGFVGFGKKIGEKPYEEREIEFLNSLSNIAATAVANGLNVDEIKKVNRNLDRKIQQLNTIFDISQELNTTLDAEKIGSILSFAVMGELLVNKCLVLMNNDNHMEIVAAKGFDHINRMEFHPCRINEPVILEESNQFETYKTLGIAVLVPMSLQDETKGVLAIGSKISGADFTEADFEFLKTLGNQAMTALENARLFQEALEKQRMEEELHIARTIQQGLLPSKLPQIVHYDVAALNLSSRQVGGDYFDVIPILENVYGITIADVSGKGAGAALLMSNLQASLHALISGKIAIHEIVTRINHLIHKNTAPDKFITFFYGQLDVSHNRFTYCNAGHNPPYRIDCNGQIEELGTGGLILGMMVDIHYETASIDLKPGDRLVLYTDGITEAMNKQGEEFGEGRLKQLLLNAGDLTSQELIDHIVHKVNHYAEGVPQADDMTMVILKAVD